eukprot:NODE_666_length_5382_cov_0.356048.p3 type:complete len:179 gc:universal NODE_666_length_5382_cov_0.356048:1481-945(-)
MTHPSIEAKNPLMYTEKQKGIYRHYYVSHLKYSKLVQYEILTDRDNNIAFYKTVRRIDFKEQDSESQQICSLTLDYSMQLPNLNFWQNQIYNDLYCLILSNQYPLKIYCYNYPILTVFYPHQTCPPFSNNHIYLLSFSVNKSSAQLIRINEPDPNHPHFDLLVKKSDDFIHSSSFSIK